MKRNARGNRLGSDHHRSRLREDDVVLIWEMRAAGLSYAAIAEKLDDHEPAVSWRTVVDVLTGRTWAHVPVPDDVMERAELVGKLARARLGLPHDQPD